MPDKHQWLENLAKYHYHAEKNEVVITTSREKYGSAVSSSSYISSCDSDSVDSGGVQVVDGVGVAR